VQNNQPFAGYIHAQADFFAKIAITLIGSYCFNCLYLLIFYWLVYVEQFLCPIKTRVNFVSLSWL
jgi:hypothetical protein